MMRISYQTARWVLCAGLLSLGRVGAAQTAPTPDDSLKGRLWTATAGRIWADTKPKQKQPAPWPTVQAFERWLTANPADKSELGLLHADVVSNFGAGTKATGVEVAQAIIDQVNQRQQSGAGRLTRVKVPLLGADLAPLTQVRTGAASASAAPNPTTGTTTVSALPGPNGVVTVLPANPDSITNPRNRAAEPVAGFTVEPPPPRYFGLTPLQAAVLLVLLGGLAGIAIGQNMRRPSRRRRSSTGPTPPAELDSTSIMTSLEYRKLQKQNQTLNTQLHRLRQELAELKERLPGAAPTPPPAAEAAPVAEPPSVEELVGAPPAAAPTPLATRYGPVQETPFVEERKLVDTPLPQLALMLTVSPTHPDQASFTLNPQVDQARLIGDGLTRLQKFFDYDPPLGGRITAVAAVRPGRLQRQDSGWQVVERARLAIS